MQTAVTAKVTATGEHNNPGRPILRGTRQGSHMPLSPSQRRDGGFLPAVLKLRTSSHRSMSRSRYGMRELYNIAVFTVRRLRGQDPSIAVSVTLLCRMRQGILKIDT